MIDKLYIVFKLGEEKVKFFESQISYSMVLPHTFVNKKNKKPKRP